MAARQLFSGQGAQLKRAPEQNVMRLDAPRIGPSVINKPAPQPQRKENQFNPSSFLSSSEFFKFASGDKDYAKLAEDRMSQARNNGIVNRNPLAGMGNNQGGNNLPQTYSTLNQAGLAPQPQNQGQTSQPVQYQPQPTGQQLGPTFDPTSGQEFTYNKDGLVTHVNGVELANPRRPGGVNAFGIGPGNALNEGVNFEFQNLPQLQGLLDSLFNTAQGAYNQGQNLTGLGQNQLTGTAGETQSTLGSERNIQGMSLAQLQNLQSMGIDPTLSQNFQTDLADTLARRKQAVNERFTTGDMADQFARERGLELQRLAKTGMTDSTTAENTLSNLEAKLMRERANQLTQAEELTRQEGLAERTRIGETATQFGGLQGAQARTGSTTLAQLLGVGEDIGSSLGGLGVNLQNIGLEGLTNQAQLSQQERDTLADLQLAALNQRLGARQGTLENLFGANQARFDKRMANEQLAIQQALLDNQTGWGSRLFNMYSGMLTGAAPTIAQAGLGGGG